MSTLAPALRSRTFMRSSPRLIPSIVVTVMMFATGAAGLVYEYIIATVITYLEGNSLYQMSFTTGVMLVMMGVGGVVQAKIKHSLIEVFIFAEVVLIALGAFAPLILQWMFANMPNEWPVLKFLFLCLMGLLVGFEIPLMARINERFSSALKNNMALIYASDYAGAAAGLLIYLYALKHYVPMTDVSFIVAGFNLIAAVVALSYFWKKGLLRRRKNGIVAAIAIAVVSTLALSAYGKLDTTMSTLNQSLYENPIVHETQTSYQNITITETSDLDAPDGKNVELFLNGNKQFASKDEHIYHELLVHPAMNLAARHERVLILGGGDGMAMREVLKYPDVKEVSLVDLDPAMIELAKNDPRLTSLNGNAFADARVHSALPDGIQKTGETREILMQTSTLDKDACEQTDQTPCDIYATTSVGDVDVYTLDADLFMSRQSGPWDVVIIDLPDPNSVELAKLYSQEFYTKVRENLAPDGIVTVQATSPYHAKETYLCIMRTMAAAGLATVPYHANVPSFGDWGWIIGAPGLSNDNLSQRAATLPDFPVETREITNDVFVSSLVFNRSALQSSHEEISTVMNPVVTQYYTYEGWRTD